MIEDSSTPFLERFSEFGQIKGDFARHLGAARGWIQVEGSGPDELKASANLVIAQLFETNAVGKWVREWLLSAAGQRKIRSDLNYVPNVYY
jgi:hypothetical protein